MTQATPYSTEFPTHGPSRRAKKSSLSCVERIGDCQTCGNPLPPRTSTRGRPRIHCSAECREFSAALSVMLSHLGHVQNAATPDAWTELRGKLWQAMNARSATRGVPNKAVAILVEVVDGTSTEAAGNYTSWNMAWKAVDAMTGSKGLRGHCRKTRAGKALRSAGFTHTIRVPSSVVRP